jgi:galactose mutarotase-like enzyme
VSEAGVASELDEIEITRGEQRVDVVVLGGGLRSYEVAGRELLNGFPPGERPASGRGQVLVPWPNRIENGSYEFEGKRLQLPLNEPENGNAIHGLVRGATWNLVDREPGRVLLDYTLEPEPGYPFPLGLSIEYALSNAGLTVTTTARNLGRENCPYGAGQHPYLTLGTPTIDRLRLQIPGRVVEFSDERGLPVRSAPVEGTEYDFRAGREIGETVLDNAFTELDRDDDGRARVLLDDPASGAGLTLWVDENYRYLMLYTGDSHPDVARHGLAVEPMTCPPNAFRTGTDLIVLEPNAPWTGAWGIRAA